MPILVSGLRGALFEARYMLFETLRESSGSRSADREEEQ